MIDRLGNEYDYTCKGFELKAVSRSEFEALKRFGDYEKLHDGTLMRIEGDKEFRIYREASEWPSGMILTEGVLNLFADLCDVASKESRCCKQAKGVTLRDNVIAMPLSK
jgi:hypothetical protein